ncbi:MAG: type II toxin-antitoxin system CcdA family antitoxin, partial [Nitrosomonas sp.]|nr:type II toxin-antitoxin system CcdA family antitoxin [Nitrosomonas sp.]
MRINYARNNNMTTTYDISAPKKPTNLTVNSDLLRIAKALKINVSATLEQALADKVREQQRQVWLAENLQAINDYNQFVEHNGAFSDGMRK